MKGSPADFLCDERLREIERIAAAELVMKIRDIEKVARVTKNHRERSALAKAMTMLGNQALAAAARMERPCPDEEIPEFIREGSAVDVNEPRRRKSA